MNESINQSMAAVIRPSLISASHTLSSSCPLRIPSRPLALHYPHPSPHSSNPLYPLKPGSDVPPCHQPKTILPLSAPLPRACLLRPRMKAALHLVCFMTHPPEGKGSQSRSSFPSPSQGLGKFCCSGMEKEEKLKTLPSLPTLSPLFVFDVAQIQGM